jgi:catechol 2,3-dioxygenase-like lactoylglutathione lyase family enzyme
MTLQDFYPLLITENIDACRDFYTKKLGFELGFDAPWFIWLRKDNASLAFMQAGHESQNADDRSAFSPQGIILTLQVEDARAEHERMQGQGIAIHRPLHDEPWGQRHFMILDPNGMKLDIVQQIQPQEGKVKYFDDKNYKAVDSPVMG